MWSHKDDAHAIHISTVMLFILLLQSVIGTIIARSDDPRTNYKPWRDSHYRCERNRGVFRRQRCHLTNLGTQPEKFTSGWQRLDMHAWFGESAWIRESSLLT